MKFITKVVAAAFILSMLLPMTAFADHNINHCAGDVTDTTGDPSSVTVTAPEGFLVNSYCVKAGSASSGDGPVYINVEPPTATVIITYPGGKAVSHYSYSLVKEPDPSPPTTSEPTTTTSTTTTTIQETTSTSTVPSTSTTVAQETVTTVNDETTETTSPSGEETSPSTTTTTPVADEDRAETLPFTGSENIPFMVGLSLALLALGGYLIRACRPE